MTDSFLPNNYEVPKAPSPYMRFEAGDNKFRALCSPIMGNEWWVDENGKPRTKEMPPRKGDKPVRAKMDQPIPDNAQVKHFWAFVVYNYKAKAVQILQITQTSIQEAIRAYTEDPDWGNPKGVDGYDIVVKREGEKLETTYAVLPKPRKKLDEKIMEDYKNMRINLSALYEGEDPFAKAETKRVEDK